LSAVNYTIATGGSNTDCPAMPPYSGLSLGFDSQPAKNFAWAGGYRTIIYSSLHITLMCIQVY